MIGGGGQYICILVIGYASEEYFCINYNAWIPIIDLRQGAYFNLHFAGLTNIVSNIFLACVIKNRINNIWSQAAIRRHFIFYLRNPIRYHKLKTLIIAFFK